MKAGLKEKPAIVHIDLTCSFSEGFTYQENLMPKYHVRMGYQVYFITTTWSWNGNGELERVGEARYVNPDGFEVIRIENDQRKPWDYRLKTHSKLVALLDDLNPDIIFLHCCQVRDSSTVAKYAKQHPSCRLYVDNHADYSNSATNWFSKYVLHRVIWRHYAHMLEPYVECFWGVMPARVDFLVENYGLPREKCKLLVMGADDDEVERANDPAVRADVRSRLGLTDSDFLVVTGGKIDKAKMQTFSLMDAVLSMGGSVKLLLFGPVVPDLKPELERRLEEGKITYVPWADTSESYDFFAAADAICFPGRHSVYWEQAVAMGKPLIVKRWDGTEHVDVCGNVLFLDDDSVDSIVEAIISMMNDYASFSDASKRAVSSFRYSSIAKRSIDGQQL